ncbi:MAG: hypothetical protein IKN79_02975, partial [Eubacterium sp.]|nr:hypothetical protein [Eubacterium sp.]
TLDVSKNTALKYLYCYGNQLKTLDISANPDLLNVYKKGSRSTQTLDDVEYWQYELLNTDYYGNLAYDKNVTLITEAKKDDPDPGYED